MIPGNQLQKMEIIELLNECRVEIAERFSVKKIGIFGSYVNGNQNEKSDIDILVEFSRTSFDNYFDLLFFLEDLFGRKVDLITNPSLSPYIWPYVEEQVVWCE